VTPPTAFALLGLGIGALLVAKSHLDPRASGESPSRSVRSSASSLRDRVIEAQKISARASQIARELTAQWSAELDATI
jgi:hypothetical protein